MNGSPWWAIAIVAAGILGRAFRGKPTEATAAADLDEAALDADMAIFQRRLSSQCRRLDALEAVLVALAALEFAAMTYIGGTPHVTLPEKVGSFVILACVAASLIAVMGFEGDEAPDLEVLDLDIRSSGRASALTRTKLAVVAIYRQNGNLIIYKKRVARWGAFITGTILLLSWAYHMVYSGVS